MGLYTGLFAEQYTITNLTLCFIVPVFGLVIGIIGIRKSTTKRRKGVAIAGVVLCSLVVIFDLFLFSAWLRAI